MINQISWKNISGIGQEVSTWLQNLHSYQQIRPTTRYTFQLWQKMNKQGSVMTSKTNTTTRHNPKAALEINKNTTTMACLMVMPQK